MFDEIIAEIHAIKDALNARYANAPDRLFEDIQRGEAELRAAGVEILPPPPDVAALPVSVLRRTRFLRR